jgi:hypothetical protein
MRTVWVVLALSSVAALAFAGCGGDSGTTSADQASSGAGSRPAQKPLPPDAPISKVLARTFPKPQPLPQSSPQAEKWIEAGERACKGKAPADVIDEFMPAAEAQTTFTKDQKQMLGEIADYEKQASESPDFAAGQLAGGVYERLLPAARGRSGYQGCVYQLALQLRRELAGK